MVNDHVETISPDAAELPDTRERDRIRRTNASCRAAKCLRVSVGARGWAILSGSCLLLTEP